MAKMPTIGLQSQPGTSPSAATPRPTDFGLGTAAQEMSAWSAEREETQALAEQDQLDQDDEYAERIVTAFQEDFEPRFGASGAGWVGSGFARASGATYDVAEGPWRRGENEARTAGQQAAVERRLDTYRLSVNQRAVRFETEQQATVVGEQRRALETVQTGRAYATYLQDLAPRLSEINQAFDGTSDAYEGDVLAAVDEAQAAALQAVPEHLRPGLQVRFEADRVTRLGAALDVRQRTHAAVVASEAEAGAAALINAIQISPDLYDGAAPQMESLVAGLPAAERPGALRMLQGQAAEARVRGLINMGEFSQAEAELSDGRWNAVLDPSRMSSLLNLIETEREQSPTAMTQRLEMSDLVDSAVASVTATGVLPESFSISEVDAVLGPAAGARARQLLAAAEAAHGDTAGWQSLSMPEIRERVNALRPEPGATDFASAQDRYQRAVARMEDEAEARGEDAAGWAVGGSPVIQGLLQAVMTEDVADVRRQAGSVYGRAVLVQQNEADIPGDQQRILPAATAEAAVAAYRRGGPDGFADLAGLLDAFAPAPGATETQRSAARARQAMVASELIRAGADRADVAAAVDLSSRLAAQGAYTAWHRERPQLSDRQSDELSSQVTAALAPYFRSFEAQQTPLARGLREGRTTMVRRIAEVYVSQGREPEDAAEAAARVLTGNYVFVGRDGWRLPSARRSDEALIAGGATAALRAHGARDGARFYTPPTGAGGPAERREAYADRVTTSGRWATLPGDRGLVLTLRDPDGTWRAALNADGQAIAYTWDQLEAYGRSVSGHTSVGGDRFRGSARSLPEPPAPLGTSRTVSRVRERDQTPTVRVNSLEEARGLIGRLVPGVRFNSGYRSQAQQDRLRQGHRGGGVRPAARSFHTQGRAWDLSPPRGMTMAQLAESMQAAGFRVLNEGNHVHVSW